MLRFSHCATVIMLCMVTAVGQDKGAANQRGTAALPSIAAAMVPLYPPLARIARIEGIVHVKVTTDGHKVIAARSEDGQKMLAEAAERNAQTWEFITHKPTTFIITYQYKLIADEKVNSGTTVVLRLPTDVEVSTTPILISDPAPDVR